MARGARVYSRADAGFTLVEMLVSLALLAMAAVLVGQGFAADRGALKRIEGRTTAGEEVAAAQDLVRDRIEHLFAEAQFDAAGAHVDMDGGPDSLAFMSTPTDGSGAAQVKRLRLALTPDGDLVLTPTSPAAGDGARLLRGVQGLDIAYYGPGGPGGTLAWTSAWSRPATPPRLVRVRVSFPDGDPRWWPELIVRPAVTVDTACVLDPATALCRGRQ